MTGGITSTRSTGIIPASFYNKASFIPCPSCNAPLIIQVYPSLTSESPTGAPESISEGQAACFYHPQNIAIVSCESCGRFLCSVCDIEIDRRHICPGCLESGRKKRQIKNLDSTLKPFIGKYHTLTFAMVLIQGIFLGLDIISHYLIYNYIQAILGTAASIFIIIALVKQQAGNAPNIIKILMWITIVFICLSTLMIFGIKMPFLMEKALVLQYDMYKSLANISPDDSDAIYFCYIISFIGYTVLGGTGLLSMIKRPVLKRGV
jgi:hypothetical protein